MNINPLNIQLIPQDLEAKLFANSQENDISKAQLHSVKHHLKTYNINTSTITHTPYLEGLPELPPVLNNDIIQHLDSIAANKYTHQKDQLLAFIKAGIPELPTDYIKQPYWTRYTEGLEERVDHPLEDVFIIDCETYVNNRNYPVMASAVSNKAFYLWLHPCLVRQQSYFTPELISVGNGKLIVNHNVKFDTAHFKETYTLFPNNPNFYFDTLSAHIAVCGMSTKQRLQYAQFKSGNANYSKDWVNNTAPGNLVDCYNFHVKPLRKLTVSDKLTRDIFVKSTTHQSFIDNLDELTEYNFLDCIYTYKLAQALIPKYFKKKPNIITFGAHLGINQAILPVAKNWEEWLLNTTQLFNKTSAELNEKIKKLARQKVKDFKQLYEAVGDDAMNTINRDPWLSQLDWTPAKTGKNKGVPAWWRKVSSKEISTKSRLTPLLLELSWKGQPLVFINRKGWCYEALETSSTTFTYQDKIYAKVPHPKGDTQNCGNPLGKSYIPHLEAGLLTSSNPDAKDFLEGAKSLSYWSIYQSRVFSYRATQANDLDCLLIEPTLLVHGTASNRSVEKTWLTVSKPKKNIIGSEIKSRVRPPTGYSFVGADMDAQEVKIAASFADAYRSLEHGSTPMSYTTLFGNKDDGTDSHSLLAKDLNVDREIAKPINFQMIYLAGEKALSETLKTQRPDLTMQECKAKAKKALESRRGKKVYNANGTFRYEGGTDSDCYNFMLALADTLTSPSHIANLKHNPPQTPALNSGMSDAITVNNCGKDYLTSRSNWGIQSSGVDLMHMFRITIEYLFDYYKVKGRWFWNIHDEYWSIVANEDTRKAAWCYQVAHLFTWAYFFKKLGFSSMPNSYQWFSSINIDTVLRKEVYLSLETPSNHEDIANGLSVKIEDLVNLNLA